MEGSENTQRRKGVTLLAALAIPSGLVACNLVLPTGVRLDADGGAAQSASTGVDAGAPDAQTSASDGAATVPTNAVPSGAPTGPTGPSNAPAYVAGLNALQSKRLQTVKNGSATWFDALPNDWKTEGGDPGGLHTEFPYTHLWGDWSGGIALPNEHKLTAQGGGHSSSAMNGIIGFDFNGDTAPTGFYIEPGSLSNVAAVTPNTAAYSDGKANAHHTYDGIWFDPASNAIYRASGSMFYVGSMTDQVFKFDRGAQSWKVLGSWGASGGGGTPSTLFDPQSRKTVVHWETAYVVIDGAKETGTQPSAIGGDGSRALNVVSAWNPATKQGFVIEGTSDNGKGVDVYRAVFDPGTNDFSLTRVTSSIKGSLDMLSTEYGPGFLFDAKNDCYWAYDPQGFPGFLYRFDPATTTFTKYALTGDVPDYAGGKGTFKRLALFSDWSAIGFFGKYNDNAYVIRLPAGF